MFWNLLLPEQMVISSRKLRVRLAQQDHHLNLLDLDSTVCAIGDVHGRSDLLSAIIAFLEEHSAKAQRFPRVYFLGDIVDRGPDSREAMEIVCQTLKRWPKSRLLLGNHDYLFRDALTEQRLVHGWHERGGSSTLASYLGISDFYSFDDLLHIKETFPEHLQVLQEASIFESFGRYLFVHAGIDPTVPLSSQTLFDLLQIRGKFLDHVGPLSHVVVHGHSPTNTHLPIVTENRVSLDTGAVHSDVLTMAVIDTDSNTLEFYSTDRSGSVRKAHPTIIDRGLGTIWHSHPRKASIDEHHSLN